MSAIAGRATEQSAQTIWNPVPEGLWRWTINTPVVALDEKFSTPTKTKLKVLFPLELSESEKRRLAAETDTPDGAEQSWRVRYTTGWSPGFFRDNAYQTTRMIDFLSVCFGSENTKRFKAYMEQGGGPATLRDNSLDDDMAAIADWLAWWVELEVYGTITHELARDGSGKVFTVFAGPMAVGSLPGQKEPEYQALGRGKLRQIVAETMPAESIAAPPMPQAQAIPPAERPVRVPRPAPVAAQAAPSARGYEAIFGPEDAPEEAPF